MRKVFLKKKRGADDLGFEGQTPILLGKLTCIWLRILVFGDFTL
jgi:hypothetical protein